jgi:hypothetical protein
MKRILMWLFDQVFGPPVLVAPREGLHTLSEVREGLDCVALAVGDAIFTGQVADGSYVVVVAFEGVAIMCRLNAREVRSVIRSLTAQPRRYTDA